MTSDHCVCTAGRGGLVKSRWGGEQAENDEGKMRSQENWKKDSMLGIGVVAGDALVTRLCRKSLWEDTEHIKGVLECVLTDIRLK